jgi:hypothetical protein
VVTVLIVHPEDVRHDPIWMTFTETKHAEQAGLGGGVVDLPDVAGLADDLR